MSFSATLKIAIAISLVAAASLARAQVANVPFPANQSIQGSLGASVIFEPSQTNVELFTNTRGTNVVARVSDFILTNGGNTLCYVHFANQQGDILVAEVAVPPGQTLVLGLGNGVPIVNNASLRAVRSDLFAAVCNSRMVISVRGWFTVTN